MRPSRVWRIVLLIVDVLLLDLGYYWSFVLRFRGQIPLRNLLPFLDALPYITLLGLGLVWAYELNSEGWYRPAGSATSVLLVVGFLNVGTMVLTFWLRGFSFPRTVFLLAPVIQTTLLLSWRLLWSGVYVRLNGPRRVAVVHLPGDRRTWEDDAIRAETGSTSVLAVVDDEESALAKSLDQVDVIYLSTSLPRERREVLLTAALAANKEVYLVPDLYDILLHNADRTRVGDKSVFHLEGLRLSPVQRVVKRLEDLLLAGVAALIGLTIFPPVAIAVWRSSPGPIFYRQERVGRNGRRFSIYKFRTMVADAERLTGPVLATENDPRITAVGRFLRATRLDELPQIINILRGEMSFVGPRPERPVFVEEFSARLPAYRCRLAVKPGLTGLAQVNGRYSTDAVDKLRYDLYYIRNYSPLLDLRIILQTVRTVLSPAAAAGLELSSRDDVAG